MDEDREHLAAEYVLGTLDADERAQAEALMLVDAGFVETVAAWERRLGELNVLVAPVEPAPAVWERIRSKLPETARSGGVRLPDITAPAAAAPAAVSAPAGDADVMSQRVRRWRGVSVMTAALAAGIAAFALVREFQPQLLPPAWQHKPQIVEREVIRTVEKPVEVVREVIKEVPVAAPAQTQFVAVFTDKEEKPAFVMSVDIEKRTVTVRRVAAEEKKDRVYQLWIATEQEPRPRSLGLLEASLSTVRPEALQAIEPATFTNVTFGISDEPMGGSPQPTTPAIHARLVTPPPVP